MKQYEETRYSTWDDPTCDYNQPSEEESQSMEQKTDEWQAIAAQLDYWADLDREYWRQRKEKAYEDYLNRKLKQ